jgi:hypothetical protein
VNDISRATLVLGLLSVSCAIGESLDSDRTPTGGAGSIVVDSGDSEGSAASILDGPGGSEASSNVADSTTIDAQHFDAPESSSETLDTGPSVEGGACGGPEACGANLKCKCCSPGVKCLCATECASDGDCKSTDRCAKAGFCAPDGYCG